MDDEEGVEAPDDDDASKKVRKYSQKADVRHSSELAGDDTYAQKKETDIIVT